MNTPKKNVIKTKVHTIYLLVGPSGCGKTHFTTNYLIPSFREVLPEANIQHLSSDHIRNEVLGGDYDKYDPIMLYASEAAFSLLSHKLNLVTSFPINAEFVIVDSTGLNADFRTSIVNVAQKNNYRIEMVLFDYKGYDEYARYTEGHKKIIYDHVKRMREDVYPNMRSRDFDNIVKIKSKDFDRLQIVVENADLYKQHMLTGDRERYEIIGDVHGCYDHLVELLRSRGFTIVDDVMCGCDITPILVGDWIDKGTKCREVIKFLHKNPRILLTLGNHENFVYKWLTGKIDADTIPEDFRKEYFSATELLKDDPELRQMFFDLVERSKGFWKHRDFIVTHAPCRNRDLGKLDEPSLKRQRNLRLVQRADFPDADAYVKAVEESISFLAQDGVSNHPKHIFGHIPAKIPFRIKYSKIGIDTGCVSGGGLTCAYFDGHKVKFTMSASAAASEELVELFSRREQAMAFDRNSISPEDWRRVVKLAEDKVNFISGTMSPAEKMSDTLESVERALDYYRSKGVDRIVMQPKWMGSRANLYLSNTDEKSYMVSRNGFRIREFNPETGMGVNLDAVYAKMKQRLAVFMGLGEFAWIVIDGELMPWYALGSGLINEHYMAADEGIRSEIGLLTESGFDAKFAELQAMYAESGFDIECSTATKNDLIKKHGHAKYETLLQMRGFSLPPVPALKEMYDVYHRQLELYARPAETDYKPFALLKGIKADGTEKVFVDSCESNLNHYRLLTDDECCNFSVFDINALAKAEEFFNDALTADHEGVVIKPDQVFVPNVAPYLKVRNPKYLSIIYGYDYTLPHKMAKLLRQKNTKRKVELSINEFDIGRRLLQIPRSQISTDNNEYLKLVLAMVAEEQSERTLDPRL